MRSWTACLLASVLAASAMPQEPASGAEDVGARPKDAKALFERFARIRGLEARYEEEKHLALLAMPLKSRGVLFALQPGYLTRIVEEPEESRLTITPDELRMVDRSGTEVLDLRKNDEVRVFVTSILRVFLGDRKGLEPSYEIRYEPSAEDELAWTLHLTPRKEPLDKMLRELVLRGRGERVEGYEIVEPSGDRTVTKIVRANPERRFTAEEKRELFGIEDAEEKR